MRQGQAFIQLHRALPAETGRRRSIVPVEGVDWLIGRGSLVNDLAKAVRTIKTTTLVAGMYDHYPRGL